MLKDNKSISNLMILLRDSFPIPYCMTNFFYLLFRAEREYVIQEDFMKAVRKVSDNKKLESKLDYKPV